MVEPREPPLPNSNRVMKLVILTIELIKPLLLNSKNSVYEKNASTYVPTLRRGYLGMKLKLPCPSNESLYFLQISLYVEHVKVNDIHPPIVFYCRVPCISSF